MASIQIPNLPAVIGLDGSELFEGVQAGTSVKISLNQMIAATRSGLPTTLPIPVSLGGTGATTLTGYVQGNGTAPFTASPTIPNTDITGLGTMSTQDANAVAITGGTAAFTGASSVTVNSASTAFTVTQTGAGNAFVVEDSASDTTPFVIDASGLVGVGVSPTRALDVNGAINMRGDGSQVAAYTAASTSIRQLGSGGIMYFDVGSEGSSGQFVYRSSNGFDERMRIDASGNVMIGTTAALAKLVVAGGFSVLDAAQVGYQLKAISANGLSTITAYQAASQAIAFETTLSGTIGERMRIDASGNVGIGTGSPSGKLDVSGGAVNFFNTSGSFTLNLTGTAISEQRLITSGTTPGDWRFQTGNASSGLSGALRVYDVTANAERMRIDASGNVGIGTNAPDALLSVNGAASFGDGSAASPSIANFGDLNTGLFFPAADTVAVSTAGTERLRVDSSGNVGIGTSSPDESLSIAGTSASGNKVYIRNTNNSSDARAFFASYGSDTSGNRVSFGHNAYASAPYSFDVTRSNTAHSAWAWSSYALNSANETQSAMTLQYVNVAGTQTERMRIDASGNVGIGVTPSAWQVGTNIQMAAGQNYSQFGVVNNAYFDGSNFRYISTAAATWYTNLTAGQHQWHVAPSGTAGNAITFTQAMILNVSGDLGIGTTSPGVKVDVNSGASTGIARFTGPSNGYVDITDGTGTFRVQMLSNEPNVGSSSNHALNLITNNTKRMQIDASGNITQANATSGNGAIVGQQTFRLAANGTAFGAAIGDFFGATSAISLEASSVYEITIYAVMTKTTAGTATWTLTASSAPTRIIGTYQGSPVTGIAAGAPISGFTGSQGATTAAFSATGSLTTAVNHAFQFTVQVQTNAATSFKLQLTQSAGTATPLAGSYYTVEKISATTGTFV